MLPTREEIKEHLLRFPTADTIWHERLRRAEAQPDADGNPRSTWDPRCREINTQLLRVSHQTLAAIAAGQEPDGTEFDGDWARLLDELGEHLGIGRCPRGA